MSEIKRGDLVYIARTPCCMEIYEKCRIVGCPFIVEDIINIEWECDFCGESGKELMATGPRDGGAILRVLKKIDPPATGEYDGVAVRKPIKHKEPA